MARKITSILTKTGKRYTVSGLQENTEIDSILYRRDGLTGLNRGIEDESHYLIAMSDQMNDKDKSFKVIPADRVEELTFVEVEAEKEEDTCETAGVELKRA